MSNNIVHVSNSDGHRQAYLDLFASIFGFEKLIQPVSGKSFFTLVFADRLLFATVGTAFRRYFLVCACRAVLNKPTAALFLGANEYKDKKGISADLLLLRLWKVLPKQGLISIISFNVVPQLSKVTNDYIYDPQLWDSWTEKSNIYSFNTELSASLENERGGRKILLYIGKAKKSKSFNEFSDFVVANSEHVYGVAAGKVLSECKASAYHLKTSGMMVVDRYISDEELFSLYGKADLVWCYYGPEYDQSSGVFGRAIQLGMPTIIRQGSIVERIASDFGVPAYAIEIKSDTNYNHLYDQIGKSDTRLLTDERREELFGRLQNESIQKLKEALDLRW